MALRTVKQNIKIGLMILQKAEIKKNRNNKEKAGFANFA